MIELGDKGKDSVTGFTGVVVARTEWLWGCVRIAIEATKLGKDGKPAEEFWFDEDRVTRLSGRKLKTTRAAAPGGPKREGNMK